MNHNTKEAIQTFLYTLQRNADEYVVGSEPWWNDFKIFMAMCKTFDVHAIDEEGLWVNLSTLTYTSNSILANFVENPKHQETYPLESFINFDYFTCQLPTLSSPQSPPTVPAQNAADQTQQDSSQTDNEFTSGELRDRVISLSARVSGLEAAISTLLTALAPGSKVDLTSFFDRIEKLRNSASGQTSL